MELLKIIIGFSISMFVICQCWIYQELHDFDIIMNENGDKIVKLGQSSRLRTLNLQVPSVNLMCRNNQPFALVVKWRMPLHGKEPYVNLPNYLEPGWFDVGDSLSFKKYPPVTISSWKINNSEYVGLTQFYGIRHVWIETLVSKPLHKKTISNLTKIFSSDDSFGFHPPVSG